MEKKFDLISLLKAVHYGTCDVYVATEEQYANDRHASLFKGQEEEDGKTVDILDIVIDTGSHLV